MITQNSFFVVLSFSKFFKFFFTFLNSVFVTNLIVTFKLKLNNFKIHLINLNFFQTFLLIQIYIKTILKSEFPVSTKNYPTN